MWTCTSNEHHTLSITLIICISSHLLLIRSSKMIHKTEKAEHCSIPFHQNTFFFFFFLMFYSLVQCYTGTLVWVYLHLYIFANCLQRDLGKYKFDFLDVTTVLGIWPFINNSTYIVFVLQIFLLLSANHFIQWMVRRWIKYLGCKEAIGLMTWNNSDPMFSLRFVICNVFL